MGRTPENSAHQDISDEIACRSKSKGGHDIYLIVCSDNDEFSLSLHYTARLAEANNAYVGVLATQDDQEFQHWKNVENMMRKEIRENTEKKAWSHAKKINEINGQIPVLYIREGKAEEAVLETLEQDPQIKMLILTGGAGSGGPSALVNYFTAKGLSKLNVPLVIVPGNIQQNDIDALFNIAVDE